MEITQITEDTLKSQLEPKSTKGTNLFLFKDIIKSLKFSASNYVRLLPQPVGAENKWTTDLAYLYITKDKTSGRFGYLPISDNQYGILSRIKNDLYGNPETKPYMYTKDKQDGVDLRAKFCQLFMGFDVNQPNEVVVVRLPGNNKRLENMKDRVIKVQAGTKLKNLIAEKNIKGEFKNINMVNPKGGKIICINVSGEGSRREYSVDTDAELDIVDSEGNILSEYSFILKEDSGLKKFEDVIDYLSDEEFLDVVLSYIPDNLHYAIK